MCIADKTRHTQAGSVPARPASVCLLRSMQRVARKHRLVILPKRVAFPIFRQQDSHLRGIALIWMAGELDPEQIETLPLVPIHPRPDIDHAGNSGILSIQADMDDRSF